MLNPSTDLLFSTFMIMLNMINLRDIEGPEPVSLYSFHIFYVFMMSILLLNFLIAVFSDSVNNVNQNHDVICDIQMLSVIFAVEERVQWLLRRWYIYHSKKCFMWQDGKIYLATYHPMEVNTKMIS